MKHLLIVAIFISLGACTGTQQQTTYTVKFGIIEQPQQFPLRVTLITNTIPWKSGEVEPRFAMHVTSNTPNDFVLHQKIYRNSGSSPELLEESEYWVVSGGEDGGGFLSIDLNDSDTYGSDVYGDYLFAVYVDRNQLPLETVPFEIVEPSRDE